MQNAKKKKKIAHRLSWLPEDKDVGQNPWDLQMWAEADRPVGLIQN